MFVSSSARGEVLQPALVLRCALQFQPSGSSSEEEEEEEGAAAGQASDEEDGGRAAAAEAEEVGGGRGTVGGTRARQRCAGLRADGRRAQRRGC